MLPGQMDMRSLSSRNSGRVGKYVLAQFQLCLTEVISIFLNNTSINRLRLFDNLYLANTHQSRETPYLGFVTLWTGRRTGVL